SCPHSAAIARLCCASCRALWHAEIRLPRQEEGRRWTSVGRHDRWRGNFPPASLPTPGAGFPPIPRVDAPAPQRVARMLDVGYLLGLRAVRPAGQAATAAQPGIFTRQPGSIATAGHFNGVRIGALFAVLSAIASIPILLYPWPPLGDYIN